MEEVGAFYFPLRFCKNSFSSRGGRRVENDEGVGWKGEESKRKTSKKFIK